MCDNAELVLLDFCYFFPLWSFCINFNFFKEKFCIKSISLVAEFSGAPLDCVPEGSTLLAPFQH